MLPNFTISPLMNELLITQTSNAFQLGGIIMLVLGLIGLAFGILSTSRIKALKTKLNKFENNNLELKEERRKLKESKRKLEEKNNSKNNTDSKNKKDSAKLKKKNHELQEEIKSMRLQIKEVQKDFDKYKEEQKNLQTHQATEMAPQESPKNLNSFSATNSATVATTGQTNAQSSDSRAEAFIEKLKNENKKLRTDVVTQINENKTLARKLNNFKKVDIMTKAQQDLLEEKINGLNSQYYNALSELAKLKGEVPDYTSTTTSASSASTDQA